ncbi:MarR family EPS-associated transcriptional regulator [Aestuariicella sp. G3-2]|uniref:MarR family EPS-associated transcriptional regulator n=1 Tax=Pseudomaricurvus albidus TaxID=2842452 RepID=UPI001C0CD417|nr:MarR family EPS-associated transcriptional regulator [Aestuariicella albida]
MADEIHFKILRLLEADPHVSQRQLSDELGVSLGKVNYCLRALVEKGLLKANNFKNHKNKSAYAYLLTPSGIQERASLARRFLKIKMAEYERLKKEIEELGLESSKDKS